MKIFKTKKMILAVITALVFVGIFSGLQSCSSEDSQNMQSSQLEYLDLKTFEMSKMSVKDMEIIGQALQRLNIYKSKGLYQIKQTSGEQVNISEDLFIYIKKGFELTNHYSLSSSIPRFKAGPAEGGGNTQDLTHCVSYALAALGGFSYETLATYSDSKYGSNGVLSGDVGSFFFHFYPNGTSIAPRDLNGGFMGKNILFFKITETVGGVIKTTGHAVNGTYYDANSGKIFYYDPQMKTDGIVNISDVVYIYKP
jgi:hypothetical protein